LLNMKKQTLFGLSLVLFSLLSTFNIEAQEEQPFFIFKSHPFDVEKAREEINGIIKQGYTPVGLEVVDGVCFVIAYVRTEQSLFNNWALIYYSDLSKIDIEVGAMLKEGWVPQGFSYTAQGQYLLYLKNPLKMTGFRIVNVADNLNELQKIIDEAAKKGFLPYGLSYYKGRFWVFFLGVPDLKLKRIIVVRYKDIDEAFISGLNEQIARGLIPWNIAFSETSVFVLFGE